MADSVHIVCQSAKGFLCRNVHGNFQCVTIGTGVAAAGANTVVSVKCNDSYPTMVSCGWKPWSTNDLNDEVYHGSVIVIDDDGTGCYTKIGKDGYGVCAMARCCDFTHLGDVQCNPTHITPGIYPKNVVMSTECTGNDYQFMTGCTVILFAKFEIHADTNISGWYPGSHSYLRPGLVFSLLSPSK